MPDDDRINRIPINQPRQDEKARARATSRQMERYLKFAMAVIQGADPTAALEVIRQLPLEER